MRTMSIETKIGTVPRWFFVGCMELYESHKEYADEHNEDDPAYTAAKVIWNTTIEKFGGEMSGAIMEAIAVQMIGQHYERTKPQSHASTFLDGVLRTLETLLTPGTTRKSEHGRDNEETRA